MAWFPGMGEAKEVVDRATAKIARFLRGDAVAAATDPATIDPASTTQQDRAYATRGASLYRKIVLEDDWVTVQRDCWDMYIQDGDIAAALDSIGYDATTADSGGWPFRLTEKRDVPDGRVIGDDGEREISPEQETIDAVYDRLEESIKKGGLFSVLHIAATRALLLSRSAIEVVWDLDAREIVRFDLVPGIRDGFVLRELTDPDDGRRTGWGLYEVYGAGEPVRTFHPWQVLVFDWNDLIPMLTAARMQWRMLAENEADLYVLRKTRAPMRFGFQFGNATPTEIQELQEWIDRRKQDGTFGPESDLVSSGPIQVLEGQNNALANIGDLEYRRKIIHSASRKPKALLAGYGSEGINRDTLREQLKGYIRFLNAVERMLTEPIARMMRLQLVLWGFDPAEFPFALTWTQKDEREFLPTVQGLIQLQAAGLSNASILEEFGYDPDCEAERIAEEEKRGGESPEEMEDRVIREYLLHNGGRMMGGGGEPEGEGPPAAEKNGNGNGARVNGNGSPEERYSRSGL